MLLNITKLINRNTLLALILSSISCTNINTAHHEPKTDIEPQWFKQRLVAGNKPYLTFGFGRGQTRQEARKQALGEISESINVKIGSRFSQQNSQIILGTESFNDTRAQSKLSSKSQADLSGVKLVKEQCVNGTCFVSYSYDNRSLVDKLKSIRKCSYAKKLNQGLKSLLPIDKYANCHWTINYRQNSWYLDIEQQQFKITNTDWFNELFISKLNPQLRISVQPSNRLKNQQGFHVALETKQQAFVSLFLVNALGQVQNFILNKKIEDKLIFPNLNQYPQGLTAENTHNTAVTRDLLIAFSCPQPKAEFSVFNPVGSDVINSSDYQLYSYGRLLETGKSCKISSYFIYIS